MPTLEKAVRDLAANVGRLIEGKVAASPAPNAKEFTDPSLEDRVGPQGLRGNFARFTTATAVTALKGEVRRIGSFTPDTGTIQVVRDFSAAPASGDAFEIYLGVHPNDLRDRVGDAVEKLYYLEERLVAADGTKQDYRIKGTGALLTGIADASDIVDVLHETGTVPHKRRSYLWWKPLIAYPTGPSAGSVIDIRIYPKVATGSLVFVILRRYPRMTADTDDMPVNPELLLWASAVEFWRWLNHPSQQRLKAADETPQIDKEYHRAIGEFQAAAARHLPPVIRRRQMPQPFILPI